MIWGSSPRANPSPPLFNSSASARISIDRGCHGGNTSSTTNATLGWPPASRHFLVSEILCRQSQLCPFRDCDETQLERHADCHPHLRLPSVPIVARRYTQVHFL